uniref:Uncharacterized protein n=1 Tax=Glossina austeni TaxID=7395 RepID=A0A1A9ULP8_GLOAU
MKFTDNLHSADNTHINYDPEFIDQQECSQPASLPLSYILPFIPDNAYKQRILIRNKKGNGFRPVCKYQHVGNIDDIFLQESKLRSRSLAPLKPLRSVEGRENVAIESVPERSTPFCSRIVSLILEEHKYSSFRCGQYVTPYINTILKYIEHNLKTDSFNYNNIVGVVKHKYNTNKFAAQDN